MTCVPRPESLGSSNDEYEIYGPCNTDGDMRNTYKILGKTLLENADTKVVLKLILQKQDLRMWTGFICLQLLFYGICASSSFIKTSMFRLLILFQSSGEQNTPGNLFSWVL
jgi:hypothetical protein